jgi:glycosyltransferase involved in cell wall biosynthesis
MRRPELVSVIVPVRDAATTLPRQLERLAVQRYDGDWEVLVVDNGSQDGTAELARRWAGRLERLRVVDASARAGVNHARNAGARAASGDFLAFCDADDEVAPEWLGALVEAAHDADLVGGFVGFELLNPGATRNWRMSEMSRQALPVALDFLPYAMSGNCGIWRSVLTKVGGWNESYRGCTDVELSWRVQLAGYRLSFAPDAVLQCRFRSSLRGLARQFFRIGSAEVQLYHDFRGDGLERDRAAFRSWLWLIAHLPLTVKSPVWRGRVVRLTARRLGRLYGCTRARVWYP